jgi:hypothetical protein
MVHHGLFFVLCTLAVGVKYSAQASQDEKVVEVCDDASSLKRRRMAELAMEINDSVKARADEDRAWQLAREQTVREETAVYAALMRERKRALTEFYRVHNPDKLSSVSDLLDNYPFEQVVRSLLKVYSTLPAGWTEDRQKWGDASESALNEAYAELYGDGQGGV